jgi:hypothetical protein
MGGVVSAQLPASGGRGRVPRGSTGTGAPRARGRVAAARRECWGPLAPEASAVEEGGGESGHGRACQCNMQINLNPLGTAAGPIASAVAGPPALPAGCVGCATVPILKQPPSPSPPTHTLQSRHRHPGQPMPHTNGAPWPPPGPAGAAGGTSALAGASRAAAVMAHLRELLAHNPEALLHGLLTAVPTLAGPGAADADPAAVARSAAATAVAQLVEARRLEAAAAAADAAASTAGAKRVAPAPAP